MEPYPQANATYAPDGLRIIESTIRKSGLLILLIILGNAAAHAAPQTIHVLVALADNEHQWIAPVPDSLGNGDKPQQNLYWGALYGLKTHFKKSEHWELLSSSSVDEIILERLIFKHRQADVYLVADAYRGKEILQALKDFLSYSAGQEPLTLTRQDPPLPIQGDADLVTYIGHNGLMEPWLRLRINMMDLEPADTGKDAIVLACQSRNYFNKRLQAVNARGVLLTNANMAPEAYTLEAALEAWIVGGESAQIRENAAQAYSRYQKIGIKAARGLFEPTR